MSMLCLYKDCPDSGSLTSLHRRTNRLPSGQCDVSHDRGLLGQYVSSAPASESHYHPSPNGLSGPGFFVKVPLTVVRTTMVSGLSRQNSDTEGR